MAPTRRELLGTAALTVGLAGCSGTGNDSNPTPEPTQTDTPAGGGETTTAAGGGGSVTVQVSTHPELGDVLVGGDGMTLYMFDPDDRGSGASNCSGGCAEAWPPLTVDGDATAGEGVTAELSTFQRDDGSTQVAANGWPLYYWQNDEAPGDATGQGVNDVWWVLRPDGTPVRPQATVQVSSHPQLGDVLVGGDGMTLYMFDPDEQGAGSSNCSGGCAEAWPPLTVDGDATAGEGVTAELTTFQRDDGSTQVAANGWPLYYWQNDEAPGDATGQGVNDVWWVLRPDGTPVRPDAGQADVAVRSHPELSDVLVDAEGLTLYMFDSDEQGAGASTCSGGCAEAWPPLVVDGDASAGDGVTASLSTFERDDGSTQVAANGWPLYYYASDGAPGDANGQGVGDVWWVLDPAGRPVREM